MKILETIYRNEDDTIRVKKVEIEGAFKEIKYMVTRVGRSPYGAVYEYGQSYFHHTRRQDAINYANTLQPSPKDASAC